MVTVAGRSNNLALELTYLVAKDEKMISRKLIGIVLSFAISTTALPTASALVSSTSKPVSGVKFSWVVTLHSTNQGDRDQHICTGALIDDFTVITAAHCLVALANEDWVMVQGRANSDDRGRVLTAFDTKIHPDYDPITSTDDLALIYLYYPAYSSSHLKVAGTNLKFTKNKFTLYGWGTDETGEVTYQLRQAPQQQAAKSLVARFFNYFDNKNQLAMSWYDKKKSAYAGACQGDSGGPLVTKLGKTDYLVGVVSYGARVCNTQAPTVFTKVSSYRDWINQTKAASKAKHATEISIAAEPFFITGGKTLPVVDATDSIRGASLQTTVRLVTGDLPNDEIDIATLTVNSYQSTQQYGSVSLTAQNVGAWDACSMGTPGFIEVRLDLDGKLGSDRVWQYGDLATGCITDGTEMILVKTNSNVTDNCTARIQTTTKGPQVWFSEQCFTGTKTALFRMLLADGEAADVEPGSDNWMGPVVIRK